MYTLIIFNQFLSCKPNSPPTSSPIEIPDEVDVDIEQWVSEREQEELGFALLKHDGSIYTTAPASTQGSLYQITSEGLVTVQQHIGRYGHQIFSYNDNIYVQSAHLDKILDLNLETMFQGATGAIFSDEDHWYALRGNALFIDGSLDTEFIETPFDIAVCADVVGISFPFSNAHRVWINGEWLFPAQDDSLRPFLHCHDVDNDGETEWFLGGDYTIDIYDDGQYRTLSSEHFSFGHSIVFGDSDQDGTTEIWISAPDSALNNATGWVGAYHWLSDAPFAQWTGQMPYERFGYSLLFDNESVLAGAPNATYSYIERIRWNQE